MRSFRYRHTEAHAGDLVAVLGIGGLGHLGVQYAVKMGLETGCDCARCG